MRTFAPKAKIAEHNPAHVFAWGHGSQRNEAAQRISSFSSALIQRKASCACGGGCPVCQARANNLKVSQPNDPAEIEADQIADKVMRMPAGAETPAVSRANSATSIQRKCSACVEEEESIKREPLSAAGGVSSQNPDHVNSVISSGGRSLDRATRSFFEPRLGRELSSVRVHTDSAASRSAGAVDARAYTLGRNIVFGSGEYDPVSESGKHLIAHELAHVVQLEHDPQTKIQRTLAATSNCPANVHGAPADPIAELTADDERAQLMALGASNVLALEALTFADPTFGRSYVSDAYERRFGLPPAASGGQFRNRFSGTLFPTRNDAMREEMLTLSRRFQTLHSFLSGQIRYRCPGTSGFTLPGCSSITCGGSIAFSCPGGRQIAICPTFWNFPLMQTVDQRGGNMIHESVHMRLGFRPHNLGTVDQRGRNPECHAAFVADIYGFQSDDTTDCTPLIP